MLNELERKWRSLVTGCAPPECVGGAQFFAWDNADLDGDGEVICIGSNYSQYPTISLGGTKDSLGSFLSNYVHAANAMNTSWAASWRQHSWLVGADPPAKPRLFIMSNLVPWITSRSWTLLSEGATRNVICTFYRRFRHAHLLDLKTMFPKAFVVGHGIDDRTLPYLHGAISLWNDRMLWANLSFPKTPGGWDPKLQRFTFK